MTAIVTSLPESFDLFDLRHKFFVNVDMVGN